MSRLIDRILRVLPDSATKQALIQKEIEVIDGTNVAAYFFSGVKEEFDLVGDIPNIAPPFPRMFIECRAPQKIISTDGSTIDWDTNKLPSAWGVYIQADEIEEARAIKNPGSDAPDAKWVLFIIMYAEYTKGQPCGPVFAWWIPVSAEGKMLYVSGGGKDFLEGHAATKPYFKVSALDPELNDEQIHKRELDWLLPFQCCLLTISFMHCRNVKQEIMTPPDKAKREARKKHGQPLIDYRVLVIEPMRKILVSSTGGRRGRQGESGIKHALHICAGHFKHFDKKGLFGKYTGTFWWHDHLRGNADHGEVKKDYVVLAPKEGAVQ